MAEELKTCGEQCVCCGRTCGDIIQVAVLAGAFRNVWFGGLDFHQINRDYNLLANALALILRAHLFSMEGGIRNLNTFTGDDLVAYMGPIFVENMPVFGGSFAKFLRYAEKNFPNRALCHRTTRGLYTLEVAALRHSFEAKPPSLLTTFSKFVVSCAEDGTPDDTYSSVVFHILSKVCQSRCANCGVSNVRPCTKGCGGWLVSYCSKKCQADHRPTHQGLCFKWDGDVIWKQFEKCTQDPKITQAIVPWCKYLVSYAHGEPEKDLPYSPTKEEATAVYAYRIREGFCNLYALLEYDPVYRAKVRRLSVITRLKCSYYGHEDHAFLEGFAQMLEKKEEEEEE